MTFFASPSVLVSSLTALSICLAISARADEPGASTLRRVPPPPVKILPMSVIEPPRNVPAAQWKSPYCTQWADGETMCERRNARSRITCKPIAPSQNYPKPERHPVACFKVDLFALLQVCTGYTDMAMYADRFFPYRRNYKPAVEGEVLQFCAGYGAFREIRGKYYAADFCDIGRYTAEGSRVTLSERLQRLEPLGNIQCDTKHESR